VNDHLEEVARKHRNKRTNWKAVAHEIKDELFAARIAEKLGDGDVKETIESARKEVDDMFRSLTEADGFSDTEWHRRRKWERISRRLSEHYMDHNNNGIREVE
jgi:hypothetical protein